MTQQQQPLTPPEYLQDRWTTLLKGRIATESKPRFDYLIALLNEAFRTGADQELEACVQRQALLYGNRAADDLRAARRPKPPSLKEQALDELDGIAAVFRMSHGGDFVCDKIRRALEQLPDAS